MTRLRLGHVMKATIDLRIIMNEMSTLQFSSLEPRDLSLEQALGFKRRLDALMRSLPATLAPDRISLPCHFNVQYVRMLASIESDDTTTRFESGIISYSRS